jgi:predicted Kef-type K+ transport protein
MKKKLVITFGIFGLFVAVVLASIRIYMLLHESEYGDALYSEWFTSLTLFLWPSAFYLSILMEKEPIKVVIKVWTIAILFNPLIYGTIGWTVWRISKFVNPKLE